MSRGKRNAAQTAAPAAPAASNQTPPPAPPASDATNTPPPASTPPPNDPPAPAASTPPSPPPPDPKITAKRVDFDKLNGTSTMRKFLENRIGLSVRVFEVKQDFILNTPEGVVEGSAGQCVVLRQDGSRTVVSAADLAAGFTFLR